MEKVIILTGPTAVGKTEYSLVLAETYNCEIINADASQMRKELNIGTAKIDLNNVKIQHHLIDFLDPNEHFSIKEYQEKSREIITEIVERNKTPLIVGGSGLYINSTIYDYDLNNDSRSIEFEKEYINVSNNELHKLLQKYDYNAACLIHENNRKRVLRALEMSMNGSRISENICSNKPLYKCLIICLIRDRDDLYQRINERVDEMFNLGWIEECEKLIKNGIDLENISDIGYKEINFYLKNELSLDEVKKIIKQKTRNYAKRQMTWFRNKIDCIMINISNKTREDIIDEIERYLSNF